MRKRNVLAVLAAALMVLQLAGTASPAGSQTAPDLEFEFAPTSGPPGTKITFSGTGCTHDADASFDGWFYLAQGNSNEEMVEFVSNAQGEFSGEYDTTGIEPGDYTPYVLCASTEKISFGETYTVTVPVIPGSTYVPTTPARLLDTRDGTGRGGSTSPIGAGSWIDLKVTDVGGVPATGVTAVALNVVTTNASGPDSYLTVWPTGEDRPLASNLNFKQGVSVPNLVIAQVGDDGKVSIYNNLGTVHVAADVQGWFIGNNTGSKYMPGTKPVRILDTRNGTGGTSTKVGAGQFIDLKVTEIAGVPANATAVVLNVTATNVSGAESYLTVWPAGSTRPVASNLNFIAGQTVPNLVIAKVGQDGKVSIYNNVGTVDVVADAQGWFAAPETAGSLYWASNPARILDTRNGTGVPGGASGQLRPGGTLDLLVRGQGGVPEDATAVVLNVTAADATGPDSYLTVWPTGEEQPLASNLNFVAGQTVPNLVIARIGANGRVSIYNNLGYTVVVADVQGWFTL